MSTSLRDLNNHLFAQLERLADPEISAERLDHEVKRAEALVAVADQVTSNAGLQIQAAKLFATHGAQVLPHLPQIAGGGAARRGEKGDAA